jgi:hypothetical protein
VIHLLFVVCTALGCNMFPVDAQRLDCAVYTYRIDRDASLALGVRRERAAQSGACDCTGACESALLSYDFRLRNLDFYVAYRSHP